MWGCVADGRVGRWAMGDRSTDQSGRKPQAIKLPRAHKATSASDRRTDREWQCNVQGVEGDVVRCQFLR